MSSLGWVPGRSAAPVATQRRAYERGDSSGCASSCINRLEEDLCSVLTLLPPSGDVRNDCRAVRRVNADKQVAALRAFRVDNVRPAIVGRSMVTLARTRRRQTWDGKTSNRWSKGGARWRGVSPERFGGGKAIRRRFLRGPFGYMTSVVAHELVRPLGGERWDGLDTHTPVVRKALFT